MDKKAQKLGMNPNTARRRLDRTLLFEFAVSTGHVCYRCGDPLTRDTFSVDHKEDWLNSDDPLGLFFDTSNIAYSHFNCNSAAGAFKYATEEERRAARLETCKKHKLKTYTPERRRAQYLRTGK